MMSVFLEYHIPSHHHREVFSRCRLLQLGFQEARGLMRLFATGILCIGTHIKVIFKSQPPHPYPLSTQGFQLPSP